MSYLQHASRNSQSSTRPMAFHVKGSFPGARAQHYLLYNKFTMSTSSCSASNVCLHKGSSINHVTRISWFFLPLPRPCHRWSHFWDPCYLVWRPIFYNFIPRNYSIKTAVPKLFLFPFKLCFNKINIESNIGMKMVGICNIALILFFKCDVTKFRIPPSLSHFINPLCPP